MRLSIKFALAVSAALVIAVPGRAQAEDLRYCMTFVKDSAGQERIMLIGPIVDISAMPDFESRWKADFEPVARNALAKHGMAGSVVSTCTRPQPRPNVENHRRQILRIAGVKRLLVEQVGWQLAASSPAPGQDQSSSDSEITESSDFDSGAGSSGSAEAQGSVAEDRPVTAESENQRRYGEERRAWEQKIAEHDAEVARQQKEQKAAQEAVAREKANHSRMIEEYTKRQMDYEAERARHAACTNGDKSACAALGKGASAPTAKPSSLAGIRSDLKGFTGRTCEEALRGAVGMVAGSTFQEEPGMREVRPDYCIVRGYVTYGKGVVTRQ